MKKIRSLFAVFTGASVVALSFAAPAMAQQSAPPKPQASGLEEIVVTAEKREASIQDVPIAVSAFSQDALQAAQISGGPNLQLAIPNVNFSKGNFTGYNFQIRGIGSKSVGASGDQGTGVHLNGAPLTANNLFEAEFYDVERVEVLRGPQGTLYGRNATGGVVNVITAKPSYEFQAYGQATYGSDNATRLEGMVDIPFADNAGLRIAGAQLKRDGYVKNVVTGNDIDGRDLWSIRATLGVDFTENARAWFSYEHFSEDDSRLRSGKQVCVKDPGKSSVGGVPVTNALIKGFTSQGCLGGPNQLSSRETVNSSATLGGLLGNLSGLITSDAYGSKKSPQSLRAIEAAVDPIYRADSEVYTLNFAWDVTDNLTLTSLTSHSTGSVRSSEDYNKVIAPGTFNAVPGVFPDGVVDDPQVGQSNRFRTFDLSQGVSEQTSSELRLQSNFDGKVNFNVGAIAINFNSRADYYVFSNTLTGYAKLMNATNPLPGGLVLFPIDTSNPTGPTIFDRVADTGRNYYLNRQPYSLKASAVFGEVYYEPTDALKLTLGMRTTEDRKSVVQNQPALLSPAFGADARNCTTDPQLTPNLTSTTVICPTSATSPSNAYYTNTRLLNQATFRETTGRAGFDWKPDLGFTDETLIYGFYSRGYKGGGINPAPSLGVATIREKFDPELVNAFEVGSKNTLADDTLRMNLTGFYYDYTGYQISKIVNRTSFNENVDAKVKGLEAETNWSPTQNVLLTANVGWLQTEISNGSSIDNLDRTQGDPSLTVLKASNTSNCVVPTAALANAIAIIQGLPGAPNVPGITGVPTSLLAACTGALAGLGLVPTEGKSVQLSGKELPNSPEFTVSLAAQYTQPLSGSWNLVVRGDYYWQDQSFARVYNTQADLLPSWESANFSIALNNEDRDLSIKAFVKNAFDKDAVTDKYLTDDSSGLFSNIFLIEPRTYGVTVSKKF